MEAGGTRVGACSLLVNANSSQGLLESRVFATWVQVTQIGLLGQRFR